MTKRQRSIPHRRQANQKPGKATAPTYSHHRNKNTGLTINLVRKS